MSRMADFAYMVDTDPLAAAEELGYMTPDSEPDRGLWDALADAAQRHDGVTEHALLIAYGRGQQRARPSVAAAAGDVIEVIRAELERAVQRLADLEALLEAERPGIMSFHYRQLAAATSLQDLKRAAMAMVMAYPKLTPGPIAGYAAQAAAAVERCPDAAALLYFASRRAEELA